MTWFQRYVSGWFQLWWWRYLSEPRARGNSWPCVLWCRMRGHPAGEVFYNSGGFEPDHHCKTCGDNLG
jgi:hypothetical protein